MVELILRWHTQIYGEKTFATVLTMLYNAAERSRVDDKSSLPFAAKEQLVPP